MPIAQLYVGCLLIHWGLVTHICVGNLTIIGPDNGLSPGRRQAIIWTNAGILLIRPLGTNFSELLVEILIFSFKKIHLKVSSAKSRPFCLGLNELICIWKSLIFWYIYIYKSIWMQLLSISWNQKRLSKHFCFYFDINKDISWNIRTKFSS